MSSIHWRPDRIATRNFPADCRIIKLVTDLGNDSVYEAKNLTMQELIFLSGDPQLTGLQVYEAMDRMKDDLIHQLIQRDAVVDQDGVTFDLWLNARAKTWPVVPGITTALDES